MKKLENALQSGFEKGIIKLETGISTTNPSPLMRLQISNTIVMISLILGEIEKNIVHESFCQRNRI